MALVGGLAVLTSQQSAVRQEGYPASSTFYVRTFRPLKPAICQMNVTMARWKVEWRTNGRREEKEKRQDMESR